MKKVFTFCGNTATTSISPCQKEKINHPQTLLVAERVSEFTKLIVLTFMLMNGFIFSEKSYGQTPTPATNPTQYVPYTTVGFPTSICSVPSGSLQVAAIYTSSVGVHYSSLSDYPSIFSGSSLTTTTNLVIADYFYIDQNYTWKDMPNILLAPNARIIIRPGVTFTIDNCHLKAFCNYMWLGMDVWASSALGHGQLIITSTNSNPTANHSIIEDAQIAVRVSTDEGYFTINNQTVFNNNYVDISVYNITNTTWTTSALFYDCKFLCKNSSNVNANLPYAPYAGIKKPRSIEAIKVIGLYVGCPTAGSSNCLTCYFEYGEVAVFSYLSCVSVKSCNFTNYKTAPSAIANPSGVHFYSEPNATAFANHKFLLISNCNFTDCMYGADIKNTTSCPGTLTKGHDINNTTFTNALQGIRIDNCTNLNTPMSASLTVHPSTLDYDIYPLNFYYDCRYGIFINNCSSAGIKVTENYFISSHINVPYFKMLAGIYATEVNTSLSSQLIAYGNNFYLDQWDGYGVQLTSSGPYTQIYNNNIDINNLPANNMTGITLPQPPTGISMSGSNGSIAYCNRINDFAFIPQPLYLPTTNAATQFGTNSIFLNSSANCQIEGNWSTNTFYGLTCNGACNPTNVLSNRFDIHGRSAIYLNNHADIGNIGTTTFHNGNVFAGDPAHIYTPNSGFYPHSIWCVNASNSLSSQLYRNSGGSAIYAPAGNAAASGGVAYTYNSNTASPYNNMCVLYSPPPPPVDDGSVDDPVLPDNDALSALESNIYWENIRANYTLYGDSANYYHGFDSSRLADSIIVLATGMMDDTAQYLRQLGYAFDVNNTVEIDLEAKNTYRLVNNAFIAYLQAYETDTSGDVFNSLFEWANRCPYLYGIGVFKARGILVSMGDSTIYDDDNLCDNDVEMRQSYAQIEKRQEAKDTRVLKNSLVRTFPNPTNNTLSISSDVNILSYSIYNSMGAVVLTSNVGESLFHSINVERFSAGLYKIIIYTTTSSTSLNFIKQ